MTLDRAFLNKQEGHTICCWNAPSVEKLKDLFKKAATPFDKMFEVEEQMAQSLEK